MIKDKQSLNNGNTESSVPVSPSASKGYMGAILDFLKNPRISRFLIYLFVILFILVFIINNYLYIKGDIGLSANDNHFYRSIQYYDKLVMKSDISLVHIRFPPLVYLVTTCFYVVNGVSIETARMSILLFSVIFLLAMFGIGYELGGNFGGLSVMVLAGSSPHIQLFSRSYFLDFPQTALTALAFYFLLRTDFFKNRKFSILFGLITALAMLTKWSTAFFLIVPVLWFLIPNVFHSFKSFRAFLIYLIPASIALTGTVWYLKQIESTDLLLYQQWFKYYLLITVLPALVCIISFLLLDLKWKKEEDYKDSGRQSIVNFAFLSSIFAIIVSIWFYWAGFSVQGMIPTYAYIDPRDISLNIPILQAFILTIMNFSPFLMIAGLIFMVLKNKNISRDLVVPVSLILSSLLMIRLMYDLFRVIIPLVIFGTALGGYWVGVIKNRKVSIALTTLLVLVSLASMTITAKDFNNRSYYQFALQNLDLYKPWRIFVMAPPEENDFNFHPVLEKVTYHDNDGWKNIAVYSSEHFPGDVNDIFVEAYSLGKKFTTTYCWQSNSPELFQEHASHARNGETQEFDAIDDVLIIHRLNEKPEAISDKIVSTFFNGIPTQTKTYKLNDRWLVTDIKIDRHQMWAKKRNRQISQPAGM